jgi:hypothetical protein
VPGQVALPRPAADLRNQLPNLGRINSQIGTDIQAGLEGQLSPGTVNALQDYNAAWGIGSGMPLSGLSNFRLGRNIGRFAEDLKNTAIGQYNQTIPTISRTQTVDPALQFQIAEQNAVNRSAPDPTAAGSHAEGLYQEYLNRLGQSPGRVGGPVTGLGGPAGGTSNLYNERGDMPTVVAGSRGTGLTYGGQVYYGNGAGAGAGAYDPNQPMTDEEFYTLFGPDDQNASLVTDEDLTFFE